eukprot:598278-Hanusia_phi.AAC.1
MMYYGKRFIPSLLSSVQEILYHWSLYSRYPIIGAPLSRCSNMIACFCQFNLLPRAMDSETQSSESTFSGQYGATTETAVL